MQINHVAHPFSVGDFFYSCLSRQASEYLTKEEEYDRSNEVLSEVLRMDETVSAVGERCVAAMLILQDKLKRKERYLAHHMRLPIYMNFGGKTTSPCESMNRRAKHGDKSVNSTMNGSTSLSLMTQQTDERLLISRKSGFRELQKSNLASRSPTEEQIQVKIQYMIDSNFDRREKMKVAQLAPEVWICWNFAKESSKKCNCAPWTHLPRFHRVFKLVVKRQLGKLFLWCECRHHDG